MEPTSLRYHVWFAAKTLGGLLRRHSLHMKDTSEFEISELFDFTRDIESWDAFLKSEFNIPKSTRGNFTFAWRLQVIQFFRVMDALGFNYKNVLHVSSRLRFISCDMQGLGSSKLRFHSQLTSVCRRSKTTVVIQLLHTVSSEQFGTIYECEDEIAILGFKESFLDEMERAGSIAISHVVPSDRVSGSTQHASKEELVQQIRFAMVEGVGLRFGRVSGDLNPLHTLSFLANILGHRKSFAQGMLIVNVVANLLVSHAHQKEFFFKFIKPMYLGEDYCLNVYGDYFTVSSLENQIVCRGEFR
jgi:hypothetical protein